jgi:alanine dehydrogenase
VLALAGKGAMRALAADRHLLAGLNVHRGNITYRAVAEAIGEKYLDPGDAIRA